MLRKAEESESLIGQAEKGEPEIQSGIGGAGFCVGDVHDAIAGVNGLAGSEVVCAAGAAPHEEIELFGLLRNPAA